MCEFRVCSQPRGDRTLVAMLSLAHLVGGFTVVAYCFVFSGLCSI